MYTKKCDYIHPLKYRPRKKLKTKKCKVSRLTDFENKADGFAFNAKRRNLKKTTMGNLLYIIAVVLVIFWLIGFLGFPSAVGGIIHVLLVLAVIAVVLRLIRGA
jgi:hypothetical protein